MPETIETFVGRLQTEGVEAGRQAAAKIQEEAQQQAKTLIEKAEAQARQIRELAEKDAAEHRKRIEGELRLAVRDTVLAMRDTLSGMLDRVLVQQLEEEFQDCGFLRELILEVIRQYSQMDREGQGSIDINVSAEMSHQLAHWAVHEMRQRLDESAPHTELHGTLQKAGFEYTVTNGTVEITPDSLAEYLSSLVRPELARLLSEAVGHKRKHAHGEPVEARSMG